MTTKEQRIEEFRAYKHDPSKIVLIDLLLCETYGLDPLDIAVFQRLLSLEVIKTGTMEREEFKSEKYTWLDYDKILKELSGFANDTIEILESVERLKQSALIDLCVIRTITGNCAYYKTNYKPK